MIYSVRHNMRKHESGHQIMLFGPCAATVTNLQISELNSFRSALESVRKQRNRGYIGKLVLLSVIPKSEFCFLMWNKYAWRSVQECDADVPSPLLRSIPFGYSSGCSSVTRLHCDTLWVLEQLVPFDMEVSKSDSEVIVLCRKTATSLSKAVVGGRSWGVGGIRRSL